MRTYTTISLLMISGILAYASGDAKAGKADYDRACMPCHGPAGTANQNIAKTFKVDMKDLSSSEVQGMSDDELRKIITDRKGKMKPVKSVTGKSVDDVIAYIRTLKKR